MIRGGRRPYAVEGPKGPLFAGFRTVRCAYVTLLDQSGGTLKQAMQLARHTDPKLKRHAMAAHNFTTWVPQSTRFHRCYPPLPGPTPLVLLIAQNVCNQPIVDTTD